MSFNSTRKPFFRRRLCAALASPKFLLEESPSDRDRAPQNPPASQEPAFPFLSPQTRHRPIRLYTRQSPAESSTSARENTPASHLRSCESRLHTAREMAQPPQPDNPFQTPISLRDFQIQ